MEFFKKKNHGALVLALLFFGESMVKFALILIVHIHNICWPIGSRISSKTPGGKKQSKIGRPIKLHSGCDPFVAILGKKTPLSQSSSCSLPASVDLEYRPASYIYPTACPTQHPALLKSIRYSCLLWCVFLAQTCLRCASTVPAI